MYLFDTDTISNLTRRAPSKSLIARLARTPLEQQFVSSITVGELVYGAYRSPLHTEQLLRWLDETLLPNIQGLPFDEAAARHYGDLRATLERLGTPIGDADTRIAAIALDRRLIVVTGNVRHYGRVPGLQVENWLE